MLKMNCKFCNAELKEDASFCHECGAKVEDNTKEDAPKFCKCGAELTPDIKFCAQCGAAVAENGIENNAVIDSQVAPAKPRSFVNNIVASIKAKPKLYGIIGAVVLVLIIGVSIGGSVLHNNSKPAKTSTASSSSSTTKKGSANYSDDYYETLATSALYSEVKKKYKMADPGSTKYKINKTEKQKDYTVVYGKLYLYDKYGKATTGYSDGSGSYIRTFEVKIKNSTNKVTSCTIK